MLLLTLASEPLALTPFGGWQKSPAVDQEASGSTASQLTFLPRVGELGIQSTGTGTPYWHSSDSQGWDFLWILGLGVLVDL